MNLNLNSLLISSENPSVLKTFYEKVFGKKPDMEMGEYFGWLIGNCFLTFGPHDQVKGKNRESARILFNFETEAVRQEFNRIEKVGAEVIAKPYSISEDDSLIATFADPDGNYFQLMSPWKEK